MRVSIHLHDQAARRAIEIRDERAKRMLAAELVAAKLLIP
jgi:hypothetical protein